MPKMLDLGLIAVHERAYTVLVGTSLRGSDYESSPAASRARRGLLTSGPVVSTCAREFLRFRPGLTGRFVECDRLPVRVLHHPMQRVLTTHS